MTVDTIGQAEARSGRGNLNKGAEAAVAALKQIAAARRLGAFDTDELLARRYLGAGTVGWPRANQGHIPARCAVAADEKRVAPV